MDAQTKTQSPMTPVEIALLIKVCREAMSWSQETLAELSGLTVRTIQRVEAGQPSSIDTRRAIARGFEIPDLDTFQLEALIAELRTTGFCLCMAVRSGVCRSAPNGVLNRAGFAGGFNS